MSRHSKLNPQTMFCLLLSFIFAWIFYLLSAYPNYSIRKDKHDVRKEKEQPDVYRHKSTILAVGANVSANIITSPLTKPNAKIGIMKNTPPKSTMETRPISEQEQLEVYRHKSTILQVGANVSANVTTTPRTKLTAKIGIVKITPPKLAMGTRPISEKEYYRTQERVVNTFNHNLLSRGDGVCARTGPVVILFVVLSACGNRARRDAIRETWGRGNASTRTVFILGYVHNETIMESINTESKHNQDIVQYNVSDQYENLVWKSMLGLQWATRFCRHAHFVYKTDDDMFVHVGHLVDLFSRMKNTTRVFMCAYLPSSPVNRGGKWKVSWEQYPYETFPRYCSGNGYAMSMDVVVTLCETARHVPTIPLEDVYVSGILPRIVGIKHQYRSSFPVHTRHPINVCRLAAGVFHSVHRIEPLAMRRLWTKIQNHKWIISNCL